MESTLLRNLSGNPGDPDRPAEFRPATSAEPTAHLGANQLHHVHSSGNTHGKGAPGRFGPPLLRLADHGKGDAGSALPGGWVHARRNGDQSLGALPFHRPQHLAARPGTHFTHQDIRRLQRSPVDSQHPVAGHQPGNLCRRTRINGGYLHGPPNQLGVGNHQDYGEGNNREDGIHRRAGHQHHCPLPHPPSRQAARSLRVVLPRQPHEPAQRQPVHRIDHVGQHDAITLHLAYPPLVAQISVGLQFVQRGPRRRVSILIPAPDAGEAPQRAQDASARPRISKLNVPRFQLTIGGFTGQNTHHHAGANLLHRAIEAHRVTGEQRFGATRVNAPRPRRIPDSKLQHLHTEGFCRPEVPQLVHHDQQEQHGNKRGQRYDKSFHGQSVGLMRVEGETGSAATWPAARRFRRPGRWPNGRHPPRLPGQRPDAFDSRQALFRPRGRCR